MAVVIDEFEEQADAFVELHSQHGIFVRDVFAAGFIGEEHEAGSKQIALALNRNRVTVRRLLHDLMHAEQPTPLRQGKHGGYYIAEGINADGISSWCATFMDAHDIEEGLDQPEPELEDAPETELGQEPKADPEDEPELVQEQIAPAPAVALKPGMIGYARSVLESSAPLSVTPKAPKSAPIVQPVKVTPPKAGSRSCSSTRLVPVAPSIWLHRTCSSARSRASRIVLLARRIACRPSIRRSEDSSSTRRSRSSTQALVCAMHVRCTVSARAAYGIDRAVARFCGVFISGGGYALGQISYPNPV
jgi:hypothetical protein